MRIGFIGQKGFPATWGGVEVHVEEVARRLAARGHHVTVFNRVWYAPSSAPLEPSAGLSVVDVPTLRASSLDAITHSVLSTCSALLRKLDVLHYQCMGPSLPAFVPRALGRRVIATLHGFDYRAAKWGPLARLALRAGEFVALRAPQRTVVVARHLQTHYAGRGFDTVCIPNGVTPVVRRPPDAIRQRWGLERDGYLLFIARLEPDKNAHGLIDAFQRFRAMHPDFSGRLVLAGPLLRDSYARSLSARDLTNVVLAGEVSGSLKEELLSNALAFATPSRFEGLPISLLEAMNAARPILLSDIPAHREVLPEEAGIFCETLDQECIVRGLGRLLALSAAERATLGERAARAALPYTWEETVDRLEQVYAAVSEQALRD